MIIDSDDEEPAVEEAREFEDEEPQYDPSKPYLHVLQVLDLALGTAVTHLAVCPLLADKITFAVTCLDHTVRLISLPIIPPSPESKSKPGSRNGRWGETSITLQGFAAPPDGIAMTFSKSGDEKTKMGGNVMIAAHSREITGLLLLFQIPIVGVHKAGKTTYTLSQTHTLPFQTQHLSAPATSISFNPASSNLVLTDKAGACRIYTPDIGDGSWILTLYPGFSKSENNAIFSRKTIIDAKWILGGKAIIVFCADGEWGVWDIEGAGPGTSKGILGGQSIKGGATTAFDISGWIDGPVIKQSSSKPTASTSKFAPMTPATRKIAEPVLFSGRNGQGAGYGQLSISTLPKTSTTSPADEAIAFWLEESFAVIPSIRAFWESQNRKGGGNLFGGSSGSRLIRVDSVNLYGERCCSLAQAPAPTTKSGISTELIIAAEHRLIVVSDLPNKKTSQKLIVAADESQALIPGDLDIRQIDQVLSRMDDAMDESPSSFMPRTRKVGLRA
jgi:WD40 repeat protein